MPGWLPSPERVLVEWLAVASVARQYLSHAQVSAVGIAVESEDCVQCFTFAA